MLMGVPAETAPGETSVVATAETAKGFYEPEISLLVSISRLRSKTRTGADPSP